MLAPPGTGQTAIVVDVGVIVAAVVANPPLVYQCILARPAAVNAVLVLVDPGGTPGRAAGAYARVRLHVPDPLAIEKLLVAKGADRAEIDHVAGELIGQREAGQDFDLLVTAALDDHQLVRTADLAGEAHAAAAHRAAIDEERDVAPHISPPAGKGQHVGPPLLLAISEMVILKHTLARFVADRAVDGVPQEQILFDHRPGTLHLLRLGDDDGAAADQRVAGGDEFGEHADFAGLLVPSAGFHEAHAAASHHRKAGVPAIARDLDPKPGRGLDGVDPLVLADLEFVAVNQDNRHTSFAGRGCSD